jgi:hypothetical protein
VLVAICDECVEQWLGKLEAGERNGTDGRRNCRHKHLSPTAHAAGFMKGGITFDRQRRRDGIKPIGARRAENTVFFRSVTCGLFPQVVLRAAG